MNYKNNDELVLYVSDLDGTLLKKDETVSEYTCKVINELVNSGVKFSYATARSSCTSTKVTAGLDSHFPIIVYNGAFVIDNVTGEHLLENYFEHSEALEILEKVYEAGIVPIVYSIQDGLEKYSYEADKVNEYTQSFINTRDDDRRTPVANVEQLKNGNIFHYSCIDDHDKLWPVYEHYKDTYHCVCQQDIYSGDWWLEIAPAKATKAEAVLMLKELLGCEKVVVFGDGCNDMSMFEVADESYAVSNAVEQLKAMATGEIASNNDDGVAKWLSNNAVKDMSI